MADLRLRRLWTGTTSPYRPPLLTQLSGYTVARAYNKAVPDPNMDELEETWEDRLANTPDDPQRAAAIGRAYDGAITRSMRVEQKAVGLLQVVAIGFAIIAIVASRQHPVLVVLSLVSISYLVLATLGSFDLLKVRSQMQVLSHHATDETAGLKETAIAANWLEARSTTATNIHVGVLRDLRVGLITAAIALILAVLGVGADPALASQADSGTTPTTMSAPGTPTAPALKDSEPPSQHAPDSPIPSENSGPQPPDTTDLSLPASR